MLNNNNLPAKKLKIAYCLSFFPALSETWLFNQLADLMDDGHEVTIFSIGQPEDYTRHHIIEKYDMLFKTVYRPHIPRSKVLRVLKAAYLVGKNIENAIPLLKTLNVFKYGMYALNLQFFYDAVPFLKKKDFDIVHCHFGPNGIKAVNFREVGLLRGKLITSFHGYDVNKQDYLDWPSHYGRKGLYKDLINVCDLFTVNSNYIGRKAELLSIPPEKIALLPEGLHTDNFVKDEQIRQSCSRRIVLTVARLTEFKGIKYSIQAVANLIGEYPDLEYHILGDGEQHEEMKELVAALNLQDQVYLHGASTQEKVREYFNLAQVFVLSGVVAADGEVEAQGLVIQEAQSMELPVITSDAGGAPEGLIDGETGFVLPAGDVAALTEKLRLLLNDPELRETMGKAGRAYVQQHFDQRILHQRLLELYFHVLR
ncbi:glycosyltransferase [Pontibacter ruber]|uniref:Glycosyltransferase n=1 Tax=Pontibacter ruber TaxID=1343895 RepID=A0ABW5CYG9_9BACT|nr:glycosyltransferase [Pontibacter ruber]